MINFENLDKVRFSGVGKYDIPLIYPENHYPQGEFIPMNYANTAKDQSGKIIHCFVDDYQFTRYWNQPDKYLPILKRFEAVCSPDFSTYTDMPLAMQIYNHYRKHWLAAYWQLFGMTVYPTISWSNEKSYDWCFDGEPVGGIVAVSSVGTQQNKESKKLFLRGYEEMMKRLEPSWIIFYGQVPKECDWNVIRVNPYYESIVERRVKNGRGRGSAGGGGGGGGAKMPSLTGSEKQVAWAETIRSNAIQNAANIVKDASREFGTTDPNGTPITVKAAKVVQSEVTDTLKGITQASTIINNRNSFSYDHIARLAGLESRTGQVSAARKARKK
jgi:hypothetical protein